MPHNHALLAEYALRDIVGDSSGPFLGAALGAADGEDDGAGAGARAVAAWIELGLDVRGEAVDAVGVVAGAGEAETEGELGGAVGGCGGFDGRVGELEDVEADATYGCAIGDVDDVWKIVKTRYMYDNTATNLSFPS